MERGFLFIIAIPTLKRYMENSIFIYLVYNLIIGPFFACYYYSKEREIKNGKEFALLFFIPAIGLGYWKYNQLIRANELPELPRKWYVWKYMAKVNMSFFYPAIAVCGLAALVGLAGGGLAGFYLSFLMVPIAVLLFGFAYLILVYLPIRQAKSIETEFYRVHYLKEKLKKEQEEKATTNPNVLR
jgi:hypothetical protein